MRHFEALQELMKAKIESCSDKEFEKSHWHDVIHFSEQLANEYNLNIEMGQTIAMLHDSGRIICKVYGKGHAKAGAKWAETYLKQLDMNEDKQKIICSAIKRHNKKDKIHGIYDELIKNADALAHEVEGLIDPLDFYEATRIQVLKETHWRHYKASTKAVLEVFKQTLQSLKKEMNNHVLFNADASEWVHIVRIEARKLLVLMDYCEKDKCTTNLGQLKKSIKEINKTLEYPRLLFVLKKMTLESEPSYKAIKKACFEAESIAFDKMSKRLGEIENALNEQILIKHQGDSFEASKIEPIEVFYKTLLNVDQNDPKALHKLRLKGKKLKYLKELNVNYIDSEYFYRLIAILHHALGQYQDVIGLEALLKKEPRFQSEHIDEKLKKHVEKSLKTFEEAGFALKLMYLRASQLSEAERI